MAEETVLALEDGAVQGDVCTAESEGPADSVSHALCNFKSRAVHGVSICMIIVCILRSAALVSV